MIESWNFVCPNIFKNVHGDQISAISVEKWQRYWEIHLECKDPLWLPMTVFYKRNCWWVAASRLGSLSVKGMKLPVLNQKGQKIKWHWRNNHAGMFIWPKGIIWWWKSGGLRAPQIYVAKKQSLGIFLKIHYINLGALNPQLFHHQMIPLGHMNIPAWLFLQYNLFFYFMSICATV